MSNLTILQVVEFVIKLAAFCGACGVIFGLVSKVFTKKVSELIEPLNQRITAIEMDSLKNYLVMICDRLERGCEVSEIEQERFWESYEKYKSIGGNSYIKSKVEKLQQDRKI